MTKNIAVMQLEWRSDMDYECQELENKIRGLDRRLEDALYDIRRLQDDKAEREHHHKQYQIRENC